MATNEETEDKYEPQYPEKELFDKNKEGANLTDDIRILLLGKTGSGKSSTGNSICGKRGIFKESSCSKSETKKGKYQRMKYVGKVITVVDTPGLFDTEMAKDELRLEIIKCCSLIAPGPHIILYVIGIGRFTAESIKAEKEFLDMFKCHAKDDVMTFTIIVFTGKDNNQYHGITDEEYLTQATEPLRDFIDKCGGRVVFINTRLSAKEFKPMWHKIYEMIIKMMQTRNEELKAKTPKRNKPKETINDVSEKDYYSNTLLYCLQKQIEDKIDEIKRKNPGISEEAIREELRKSVEDEGWFLKYLLSREVIASAVLAVFGFCLGGPVGSAVGAVSGLLGGRISRRCSIM